MQMKINNKRKFIFIIITALIISILFFITIFSNKNNIKNKIDLPIWISLLNNEYKTSYFNIPANTKINFYLELPNREIEGKDLALTLSLKKETGQILTTLTKDFNFNVSTKNIDKRYLYKLGTYIVKKQDRSYIQYISKGTWEIPYNGTLIIEIQNT